jgi:hypothetical protein
VYLLDGVLGITAVDVDYVLTHHDETTPAGAATAAESVTFPDLDLPVLTADMETALATALNAKAFVAMWKRLLERTETAKTEYREFHIQLASVSAG